MLYHTLEQQFIFQLAILGIMATIALAFCVYRIYTYSSYPYQKWSISFSAFSCIALTTLFIRTTSPYESLSVRLLIVFLFFAMVSILSGLIWILSYRKEKGTLQKIIHVDILNHITDQMLIYDCNGEIVLSTCSKTLERSIGFNVQTDPFEVVSEERYFVGSFSPIKKDEQTVGHLGIFHDVTDEKMLFMELTEKIRTLSDIHQDLTQQVDIDDALLLAHQKQVLSIEIQNEIENKSHDLINQISDMQGETDAELKTVYLTRLATSLRTILTDVRKIVYRR